MRYLTLYLALCSALVAQTTKVGGSGTTKVGGTGTTKVMALSVGLSTVGLTSIGTIPDNWAGGQTITWRVQATSSFTTGHFVLYSNNASAATVKAYLYTSTSTDPGTDHAGILIASTGTIVCNGSVGFQPTVAASAGSVVIGNFYWIVIPIQTAGLTYYHIGDNVESVYNTGTADYYTTPFTNPDAATWGSTSSEGPVTGYFSN